MDEFVDEFLDKRILSISEGLAFHYEGTQVVPHAHDFLIEMKSPCSIQVTLIYFPQQRPGVHEINEIDFWKGLVCIS